MKHFCFKRIDRIPAVLLLLSAVLLTPTVFARGLQQKLNLADGYYDEAEKSRAALEEAPAGERTTNDYEKVIHLYRLVYQTAPTSPKDPKSLIAVGELYQAMAANLGSRKYLGLAVQAYDLLLQEYPYSRYQSEALLASAKIYQSGLNQPEEARKRFERLLQKFPRSPNAEQARLAIARIGGAGREQAAASVTEQETGSTEQKTSNDSDAGSAAASKKAEPEADTATVESEQTAERIPTPAGAKTTSLKDRVAVTDLREWVSPASTRIVIYLDSEVKYEVGRAKNPSRVYMDLHGTKIGRELTRTVGQKTPPAGALVKSLRGAQYQLDVARIVAEVDEHTEYSVFDLPNPYRLVLELHKAGQVEQRNRDQKVLGPADAQAGAADRAASPSAAQNKPDRTDTRSAAWDKAAAAAALPAAQPARGVPSGQRSLHRTQTGAGAATAAANPPAIPQRADSTANPEPDSEATVANGKILPVSAEVASQSLPAGAGSLVTAPAVPPPSVVRAMVLRAAPPTPIRSPIGSQLEAMNLPPELPSPAGNSAELRVAAKANPTGIVAENSRTALPNRDGTRSLTRTLGLKIGRIIIDPGHGGHDTGTIGPTGLYEKDLVLDVALRLGTLLTERLGSDVIYTRQDDTFVPLETRAAIANEQGADLFLSIHANSSPSQSARGIETYYLSFATDPEALQVAARENAVSQESIHDLPDLVKKIALNEKVDESREFAMDVQTALHDRLSKENEQRKDRGVKKAPFMVLVGAKMPSVLAEIAFLSNPQEEKLLKTKQQRQKIAEALYAGVAKYADALSGVKVAHISSLSEPVGK